MPITTGRSAINTASGNTTKVLIAEQTNYSSEAATNVNPGGDFYPEQPRLVSADIAQEGTTIESAELDESAAQTQDAPGPLDVANGFSFLFSGNGLALPLSMLTQDKNPSWSIYGGTGQTIPAQVTVVAATARLQATAGDATIADDLASTTNPVKLVINVSAGANFASGVSRALITITGTDHEDTVITETLAVTGTATIWRNTPFTTRLWYKTVTKVTTSGFLDDAASTFAITARDRSALVIYRPQDKELVRYWTAEVTKGIVPNLYYGLIMQEATVSITRDAQTNFDCTFLGRRAKLYQNLDGDTGPTARATAAPMLRKASPEVFGGSQANLTAGNTDIEIAAQEITLTFNQNLGYTNALGDRFQPTPPGRDSKRLVEVEATILYSPENDYSEYFTSNRVIPNLKMNFKNVGYGTYPYEFTLEIPEAQVTADPDPSVDDQGVIAQTLTLKAVKGPGSGTEYRFVTRNSSYIPVRDFS